MRPSRRELANAIRALSMDAVQKAGSGHPGAPMGMADIAEVLWNDYLIHNPGNPLWADRDRFVLSNGHASMLLYSLLHLSGYELPVAQIMRFRQLHSATPGHPEYGATPGVETTTGPLGQGLANAVGMAIAERALAAHFNRDGHSVVDHYTYVFAGDGCLMEGISHEACSLAGTHGLGKLIVFYDDNGISIDGEVRGWFTDDTTQRFQAYGWHVVPAIDGHDPVAIKAAIELARAHGERPSLIRCRTHIGWGAPGKQGSEACHGAPLGEEEVARARTTLQWQHAPFSIPPEIYAAWDARERGLQVEAAWQARFEAYKTTYPTLAAEFERRLAGALPAHWDEHARMFIGELNARAENLATRKASQNTLEGLGPVLPELMGGSADLTGSNLTVWSGTEPASRENGGGNYLHYGVREFGMAAIANGMTLHGGFIPYSGTFLVFSEYARNALRMAALMGLRNIFVFTHDSIGVGEDGPTHQPVEQAATLRLIPNMSVWRPCDAVESALAWKFAIERRNGPTSLLFTRQCVPHQSRSAEQIDNIVRGGYVLYEPEREPDAIIIATGSEVALAVEAACALAQAGRAVRVVSMPSTDVFDAQEQSYREQVLPPHIRARLAVEAGVSDYWRKYVGLEGRVIGIDSFGESAPVTDVYRHFGLTAENVAQTLQTLLPAMANEVLQHACEA
ncbi:MAG: transketolase [Acidiferrobacterales bacterium]|nr:transketolase [Acidiferrobacterales bacterium]